MRQQVPLYGILIKGVFQMAGKIKIIQKGPSGTVQYSEGWLKKNICEFYWEFGGCDTAKVG
jgi:hypothetical protein